MMESRYHVPGLVIAYHGCDKTVADMVISGKARIKDSTNDHDWLGSGQYFWENNLRRAENWAIEASKGKKYHISNPAVIGAVIDLGICLNLMDSSCIELVKVAYESLVDYSGKANIPLPENKNISGSNDLLLRRLDCAVIQHLHKIAADKQNIRFDTIRGVFTEGEPLYLNAGFKTKTHIQICVVNPNAIKGYFMPL